jgi:hypothetical protein
MEEKSIEVKPEEEEVDTEECGAIDLSPEELDLLWLGEASVEPDEVQEWFMALLHYAQDKSNPENWRTIVRHRLNNYIFYTQENSMGMAKAMLKPLASVLHLAEPY